LVLTSAAAVVVDGGLVLAGVDVAGVEAPATVVALVVALLPQPAASRAAATVMLHTARGRFTLSPGVSDGNAVIPIDPRHTQNLPRRILGTRRLTISV
jgi:hypothetical protein